MIPHTMGSPVEDTGELQDAADAAEDGQQETSSEVMGWVTE
jgi:hypothetical protein